MKYRTFHPQFHEPIRKGIKTSTIRDKRWCDMGERVAFRYWEGLPYRSKMGIIGSAVVTEVCDFRIDILDGVEIHVDGIELSEDDFDNLALQEGFEDSGTMGLWFYNNHKMPFRGVLTKWDPKTLEICLPNHKGHRPAADGVDAAQGVVGGSDAPACSASENKL
jgi:hypothetical protein